MPGQFTKLHLSSPPRLNYLCPQITAKLFNVNKSQVSSWYKQREMIREKVAMQGCSRGILSLVQLRELGVVNIALDSDSMVINL